MSEQEQGDICERLALELRDVVDGPYEASTVLSALAFVLVETGISLETSLQAVREMYKLHAQERKP